MKAHTKLQKRIMGFNIRPISKTQIAWAKKHNAEKWFVISRKTVFCLECGHKWKEDVDILKKKKKCSCDACKTKLTYCSDHAIKKTMNYFAIVTTHKGFQIIRMFAINQYFKKNIACEYSISEVMQHWVSPEGKYETLSKRVQNQSMYYDLWNFSSELSFHSDTHRHSMRCKLLPWKFYPRNRILPIIRRNGFTGDFHDFTPHRLFANLLSDSRFETLFKEGQIELAKVCQSHKRDFEKYWASIRIAMRHGYNIQEPGIWFDFLYLLDYFGKDLRNPKVICSDNWREQHDRLSLKKTKIVDHEKNLQYQKVYEEQKAKFLVLMFKDKNLVIQPLQTIEEFQLEAKSLGHCVYSNNYFEKEESLILSARIDGKRTETIEFSLEEMKIIQSRGYSNQATEYNGRIKQLVSDNIPRIARALSA